ncbi:MAG: tRNA (adenine-N1)-methyltransferase [Anaerolineales bacterium]
MNKSAGGDLAMLQAEDRKQFIFKLTAGEQFQSHLGTIEHEQLIGKTWGSATESHLGHQFRLLQPSLRDLLLSIKRRSQIIFPKDIGYIMLRLSIAAGQRVLEAGTGSGALTMALAWSVGEKGQVISIDRRNDMQELARSNLAEVGLERRVNFIHGAVEDQDGLDPVDVLFLDLPEAAEMLNPALKLLRPGGYFGAILPTANQVSELLAAMEEAVMTDIDACEVMLRFYKTVPARLRPTDRMVAHTGYLVFGRSTAAD